MPNTYQPPKGGSHHARQRGRAEKAFRRGRDPRHWTGEEYRHHRQEPKPCDPLLLSLYQALLEATARDTAEHTPKQPSARRANRSKNVALTLMPCLVTVGVAAWVAAYFGRLAGAQALPPVVVSADSNNLWSLLPPVMAAPPPPANSTVCTSTQQRFAQDHRLGVLADPFDRAASASRRRGSKMLIELNKLPFDKTPVVRLRQGGMLYPLALESLGHLRASSVAVMAPRASEEMKREVERNHQEFMKVILPAFLRGDTSGASSMIEGSRPMRDYVRNSIESMTRGRALNANDERAFIECIKAAVGGDGAYRINVPATFSLSKGRVVQGPEGFFSDIIADERISDSGLVVFFQELYRNISFTDKDGRGRNVIMLLLSLGKHDVVKAILDVLENGQHDHNLNRILNTPDSQENSLGLTVAHFAAIVSPSLLPQIARMGGDLHYKDATSYSAIDYLHLSDQEISELARALGFGSFMDFNRHQQATRNRINIDKSIGNFPVKAKKFASMFGLKLVDAPSNLHLASNEVEMLCSFENMRVISQLAEIFRSKDDDYIIARLPSLANPVRKSNRNFRSFKDWVMWSYEEFRELDGTNNACYPNGTREKQSMLDVMMRRRAEFLDSEAYRELLDCRVDERPAGFSL